MPTADISGAKPAPGLILPVFAATLLCSALLMFLIQPMVAKTLLPALGGSPQVWNTCMVFFQAMLFAGYLYAHYSVRWLGMSRQMGLHLVLLVLAVSTLPLGISATQLAQPDDAHPVGWLIRTLTLAVGLPVFILSATAPLVQAWFARTRHRAASDPYFLYVSSNVGSFVALLAYPALVEPAVELRQQWSSWSAGYAVLAALLVSCLVLVLRFRRSAVPQRTAGPNRVIASAAPGVGQRLRWILLSFAPSSLLMGVTTFITTDVAAVPLFWVIPLALYLLTFMLAFAQRQWLPHGLALKAQAMTVILLVVSLLVPPILAAFPWLSMLLHLLAFFFAALMCHGELNRSRPAAEHLTEFYLWLSLGGMLGGIFNALLAPVLFDRLLEYPIALALVCLLRPRAGGGGSHAAGGWRDIALPLGVFLAAWAGLYGATKSSAISAHLALALLVLATAGAAVALLSFSERPVRFGLAVASMLVLSLLPEGIKFTSSQGVSTVWSARSFFGTYMVRRSELLGLNQFVHGSTLHGAQWLDSMRSNDPVAYYHPGGAFGQLFAAFATRIVAKPVGVVGLGVGGLACYGAPAADWTFYEIDPLVEAVARDTRYFTFLRDCPPQVRVLIGDARISLRSAPAAHYGLLVIDAFSSDAIPTHLLTREAVATYLDKLAPGGLLVIHISNRYLDLLPAVAALAADAGLHARASVMPKTAGKADATASPASVVVLAQGPADLAPLDADARWSVVEPSGRQRLWTDDYVNVLGAMQLGQSMKAGATKSSGGPTP